MPRAPSPHVFTVYYVRTSETRTRAEEVHVDVAASLVRLRNDLCVEWEVKPEQLNYVEWDTDLYLLT